jgi:hypothetical protein
MDNNIIKFLPNIYLSKNIENISSDFITNNNISIIIDVDTNYNNPININKILLNGVIYFSNTNEILLQILKENNSCIIISNDNFLGFLIICAFAITYLNISLIDSLSLSKKYNIPIKNNDKHIEDLFNLYKNSNNN